MSDEAGEPLAQHPEDLGAPGATVSERKAALRGQLRQARATRVDAWHSETNEEAAAEAVDAAVSEDPAMTQVFEQAARDGSPLVVASFRSRRGEPPTDRLNHQLEAAGARLLLPACVDDENLGWVWHPIGVVTWIRDKRGMLYPQGESAGVGAKGLVDSGVQVVLVPALAMGRDGTRLGQGGGYYDRVLADLESAAAAAGRPAPLTVALVYDSEVFDTVPTGPHDMPVDRLISIPD